MSVSRTQHRGTSLLILGLCGAVAASADVWLAVQPDGSLAPIVGGAPAAATVRVTAADEHGLMVDVQVPGVRVALDPVEQVLDITLPDAPLAGDSGHPALPVVRRIFCAPRGAEVQLALDLGPVAVADLGASDGPAVVRPVQGAPSRARVRQMDEHGAPLPPQPLPPLQFSEAAYATSNYAPAERAALTRIGTARNYDLYLLEVRPVAYSPGQGALALWPRIEVQVSFTGVDALGGGRLPAGMDAGVLNPPTGAARGPRGGNYLIMTVSDFAGSAPLNQFVAAKQAEGFSVTVRTVTAGTIAPNIKTWIQGLWGTSNAPDYMLIVGDSIGETWVAGTNSFPPFLGAVRYCRTDLPYACMDGPEDWIPDFPYGRWPVRTVAELQAIVDKTLAVASGNYRDPTYAARATVIAGTDPAADAESVQDYIAATYLEPAGMSVNKLYARDGATTQDVSAAFNNGCAVGAYFGHAAGFQAWGTPLFTFSDIEALVNGGLYPFLVTWSCSPTAWWYTDTTQSPGFVEKWMTLANKGAVAGYGPALSLDDYAWSTWANLHKFLFQSLYTDGIRALGPAALAAQNRFVAFYGPADPISRDYMESTPLLGDPSLALPLPPPLRYVVVTAPTYYNSAPLNQLIAQRQAQGFDVTVYNVPSGTTKEAIKAYLQGLWEGNTPPDYVVLVGDTSGSSTSSATTIPHWVGVGSKHAATDWPYVCFGGGDDWYPEIPIGRLPVTSIAQLQAMVDKTLFVENSTSPNPDYVRRVAFLANPDTNGTAEPTHDWVIANYLDPRGYESIRIYSSQGGNTAQVTAALNTGCVFVLYMGHSSSSGWWDPAFNQSNIQALTNVGRYPLAFGWSCNTAHFDNDECFGETWVRQANKGAVAYISASNYIYWGSVEAWRPSAILEKAFFKSFFEKDLWRIGPAWLEGLYEFLKDYGQPAYPGGPPTQNADVCRNFFEEFVILGDPAVLMPQPNGFRLGAAPASQSVCAPPENATAFNVSITRQGQFAESVALTVEGLPAGATASFSANHQTPPYTSTLTLGNLAAVAAGAYDLTIRGTAPSKQQTCAVRLVVSRQAPGVPTLLTPANGATGVARTPTLTWQAAPQAATYTVEVARNPSFTQIVYTTVVSTTSTTVGVQLDSGTTFYWRVTASNACGTGLSTAAFSFTTIAQRDYFTQQFPGGGNSFDLAYQSLRFIPDGSGNYYRMCGTDATALPTDPAGGTAVTLSDDGSAQVTLGGTFTFYGVARTSGYINANGNMTFTAADGTWQETLSAHFASPHICALFDDLNPAAGGTVSYKRLADRFVATWLNVPEYQTSNQNTFQIELFFNGEIRITWLGIGVQDGIVGLSAGGGVPADFIESDLSAFLACERPGACCVGTTCSVVLATQCDAAGGVFRGVDTDCDPNPCAPQEYGCVFISEIVQGTESGDCPRYVELVNAGAEPFTFFEGGLIVQTDNSTDLVVDVPLAGITIAPGAAFVIVSNVNGACTGAYQGIYGRVPDLATNVPFGFGTERFLLTGKADGSHLLDAYGVFGASNAGQPWEFTDGYAYRRPAVHAGAGLTFTPDEWVLGGPNSLAGPNPTQLLLNKTTPGTHAFVGGCTGPRGDLDGDGDVDAADAALLLPCLTGPDFPAAPGCEPADLDHDGDVDLRDVSFQQALATGAGG